MPPLTLNVAPVFLEDLKRRPDLDDHADYETWEVVRCGVLYPHPKGQPMPFKSREGNS